MDNINSINFGSINIPNSNIKKQAQQSETTVEKQTTTQQETKNIAGTDVLDFLANQNIVMKSAVKPSVSTLVNKYNSSEQIARITQNMLNEFVPGAVAALESFEEEMGAVPAFQNLSESDKLSLGAELYTSLKSEE